MRILLTSNASYVPPRGGSTRSNRVWLDHLAAHGHQCRVVSSAAPATTPSEQRRVHSEAERQGFQLDLTSDDVELTLPNGIAVSLHRELARRAGLLAREIAAFAPDWVLVSSEDLGHSLLREAEEAAPGRIVYLAHTPQFLPFGPESWSPDSHSAARVRNAAAVVVIGRHMADYVREHLDIDAHVIPPAIYGSGPFESYANFDLRTVLMVNPCAVKGISIFSELARSMPEVRFTALPGWGTTSVDRAALASIANVAILEPVRRIEQVLEQTSILVMPSLWYEGFGLIVMEAMLRGIPVVSSDSGGLVEAKQGTGFVILVRPIKEYLQEFDEVHMPRPVLPAQNIEPWRESITTLLGNRESYEQESERSRENAVDFVYGLNPAAIEELLLALHPRKKLKEMDVTERLEKLSSEQKALLLARLKSRARS